VTPKRAIVLAAGRGSRMWPLSATRPKPVLEVANEPLLARMVRQVGQADIDAVTVVVPTREGPVAEVARAAASRHGLELAIAVQDEAKGTGHALMQAKLPDEACLVANGDLFLPEGALERMVSQARGPAIGVRRVDDVREYGALVTEGDRLTGLEEKPDERREGLVNAGVYLVGANFGSYLEAIGTSRRGELEITDAVEAALSAHEAFDVHAFDDWLDVGWPWDLLAANEKALETLEASIEGTVEDGTTLEGPVHVAEGATVRTGTVIEGPAIVGDSASIGPRAYVRGSTAIGPEAKVGAGCEVKNSILMRGAQVPHLSYVGDSVLGRDVNLGAGTQVANLRHDEQTIRVDTPKGHIDSGRRKLGVVLGDRVKTGINATLNCGVALPAEATVRPGETVTRSRVPDDAGD